MSAEHLLNDDLPDDTRPAVSASQKQQIRDRLSALTESNNKPTYYDLMTLRLEAGGRLARSLKTLCDANVISNAVNEPLLKQALDKAEKYWAEICMGQIPASDNGLLNDVKLRDDLPACVEAFRIVVMEHAQREALERECRNLIDHAGGFKLLTQPQVLHIETKHVCNGDCDHDSETV